MAKRVEKHVRVHRLGIELPVVRHPLVRDGLELRLELRIAAVGTNPFQPRQLLEENHRAHLGDQSVEQHDRRLFGVEFHDPQFLVEHAQELGQIPLAQRVAQRERLRLLGAGGDLVHVLPRDLVAFAHVRGEFVGLGVQLLEARTGQQDQLVGDVRRDFFAQLSQALTHD